MTNRAKGWKGAAPEDWGKSWWERLMLARIDGDLTDQDGHWLWTGSVNKGRLVRPVFNFMFQDGTRSNNHRPAVILYEWKREALGDRRLFRTCDEPLCVSPFHHEASLAGVPDALRATHCIRGHELPTHVDEVGARTGRSCRVCDADRKREERARRKAEGVTEPRATTRTHCAGGHPLTPESTKVGSDGFLYCTICNREHGRRWRESSMPEMSTISVD